MDKNQQQLLFKLSMFEQQIRQLQQQLQAVEKNIEELGSLDFGLDEIKNSEGKEILASFGRGIFVKAKIVPDDLMVDVGSKNFVKKSIPDTKKIIREQIKKLEEIKGELEKKIEEINEKATEMIINAQGKEKN